MKKQYRPFVLVGGIILIIVGLVFVRLRSYNSASAEPKTQLILSADTQNVTSGQEFTVTMKVNPDGNSIILVEPHVTYDPTLLELQSIEPAGPFVNVISTTAIMNGKGTISVAPASPREPVTQEVDVATLKFRALQAGNTMVTLDQESFVGSLIPQVKTTNMLAKYTGLNVVVQ